MLKIGDQMPEFEVVDQDGNKVSSKDLKGKKTIVLFLSEGQYAGLYGGSMQPQGQS